MSLRNPLGILVVLAWTAPAIAAGPEPRVAIVEESDVGEPAPLSYLTVGQTLQLSPVQRLTIGYLYSCVRETLTGGKLIVGIEQSGVQGGVLQREIVPCDSGKLPAIRASLSPSGEMVFGGPAPARSSRQTLGTLEAEVEWTIYDQSPLVDVMGETRLVFERLDVPGQVLAINIPPDELLRGTFYDLATHGYRLSPGGIYRATAGGESVVIRVDISAPAGTAAIAGRLLRF